MLTPTQKEKLTALASELVNQEKARVIVEPQDRSTGYWFGGGNVIQDKDGSILVCGRYRNYGDSRTGVGAGKNRQSVEESKRALPTDPGSPCD